MNPPHVYFLQQAGGVGPIKIGCSRNPAMRLTELAPWSPEILEIIGTTPGDLKLERNIQDCFADCHYHHEWFHPHPRLIAFIDGLREGKALHDILDLKDKRGNTLGLTQAATRKRNGTTLGRKAVSA